MATNTTCTLRDDRETPPTLSVRLNRRKQRARRTEEENEQATLLERVRSKHKEMEQPKAKQVVRTCFEQIIKEAAAMVELAPSPAVDVEDVLLNGLVSVNNNFL